MEYGGWFIVTNECCGTHCAKASRESAFMAEAGPELHERIPWNKDYAEGESGSKREKIGSWKGQLEALKKLIMRFMVLGYWSEDQAREALEKWLAENPDPSEEVVDVTEEFEKLREFRRQIERMSIPVRKQEVQRG